MSSQRLPDGSSLEPILWQFDRAWQGGTRPDLDAYLADLPPDGPRRRRALVELIAADLEWRCKLSEPSRLEDYLVRYPELRDGPGLLELVAAEFRVRRRADPTLGLEDYRARFPQLHEDLDGLLQTLALPPAGAAQASAQCSLPAVPGYEVLRELGRGGMGVVYQAWQLGLGRVVALKMLLHAEHADQTDLARFQGEAESVARLQHPNVVQLFESGRHNGLPFFTLEFVPGGNLADRLRQQPLEPREAARLVQAIAQGIQHAHAHGIIHRDLKPANVLLAQDGTPKVTDFGLARRVEIGSGLTQTGAVLGTPSYMAPEQAGGDARKVGPGVDVYALGAILYESLTGRPPFRAATMLETLQQVLDDEPVAVRTLQPGCPRDLETICHKCLHKDMSNRYATAQALADDLQRFQSGKPITARPVGLPERAVKWGRRHPSSLALLALVLLLAAVGGVWLWEQQQRRASADRVVLMALGEADALHKQAQTNPLDPAKYREALAAARKAGVAAAAGASETSRQLAAARIAALEDEGQAVTNDRQLLTHLTDVRGQNPGQGRQATLDDPTNDENWASPFREWGLEVDQTPTAEAAARLKKRPRAVVIEVAVALDEWSAERRRHSTPERWRRVRDLALALDDEPDPVRRELREIVERDRLRQERALSVLAAALRPVPIPVVVPLGEDGSRLVKLAEGELAKLAQPGGAARLQVLGVVVLARALHDAGEDVLAERLLRATVIARPQEVVVYHLLGLLLSSLPQPRWQEAVECYAAARAVRPDLGLSLAWALKMSGRHAESDALFDQMLRNAPDNPYLHLVNGYRLYEKGNLPQAIEAYEAAIQRDPKLPMAHFNLGHALHATGDLDGAVAAYRRAVAIDPRDAEARYNLGGVLEDRGDRDAAIEAYRQANKLDPRHVNAHLNLGNVLRSQGRRDEALAEYRRALDLAPTDADPHLALGNILYDQGDRDGAVAEYRRAIELDPKFALAYNNLANTLWARGDVDGAIAAFRRAAELNPRSPDSHLGLGRVLRKKGRLEEAIAEYRRTIELNPGNSGAHYSLGTALREQRHLDLAAASLRRAVELDPELAWGHSFLGQTLIEQGRYTLARDSFRRVLELLPEGDALRRETPPRLQQADRFLALEKKLSAVLDEKKSPADAAETVLLAQMCEHRKKWSVAARLYADALQADPALATDLQEQHRFHAARVAVLAAGSEEDARPQPDKLLVLLRQRALAWFHADLQARTRLAVENDPARRQSLRDTLRRWQNDPHLSSVRDEKALEKLSDGERVLWQDLWHQVEQLVQGP